MVIVTLLMVLEPHTTSVGEYASPNDRFTALVGEAQSCGILIPPGTLWDRLIVRLRSDGGGEPRLLANLSYAGLQPEGAQDDVIKLNPPTVHWSDDSSFFEVTFHSKLGAPVLSLKFYAERKIPEPHLIFR